MKVLEIRREGAFKTLETLKQVLNVSPQKALSVDEIRKRCRVLDVFDKVGEKDHEIELEDLDHLTLRAAVEAFPWTQATPDLLRVIDDVLNAKTPPKPDKPKKT